MIARDLIETARSLVPEGRGRPRQADLRRAVSTTYYATFHRLAQCCADRLVGTGPAQQTLAWNRVYRALSHSACARAQSANGVKSLPPDVRNLTRVVTDLKSRRHSADYDPSARFTKSGVSRDMQTAVVAMDRFDRAGIDDQRALAVFLLFRERSA